jgi:hypothetical protein
VLRKEEARNKKAGGAGKIEDWFDVLSYVEDKAFSLFKYTFIRYYYWSLIPERWLTLVRQLKY